MHKSKPPNKDVFDLGFTMGVVSFQNKLSLNSPSGELDFKAASVGLCGGANTTVRFSDTWSADLNLCVLYAQSDATGVNSSNAVIYSAKNVSSIGGQIIPSVYWSSSPALQLGLSGVFIYKATLWPLPPTGYSFSAKSPLGVGATLAVKMQRDGLDVIPKFGFVGGLTQWYWSLSLGYRVL